MRLYHIFVYDIEPIKKKLINKSLSRLKNIKYNIYILALLKILPSILIYKKAVMFVLQLLKSHNNVKKMLKLLLF